MRLERIPWRAAVALLAVEQFAQHGCATFLSDYPRPLNPRRLVSNMLKVAACELGDPVILGVEVKSRNGLLHRPSLGERCSWPGAFWTDTMPLRNESSQVIDAEISPVAAIVDGADLQLHLTAAQQTRLSKRSTSNPLAYDYYTRGVFSYDQRIYGPAGRAQNEVTIDLFKRALAADPNYALAHARLAHAYAFYAVFNAPDEQEKWISLANDEMNRADAIDAQLPETHLARSLVLFSDSSGYQAAAAIREARAAQRLDPNLGQYELAGLYSHVGLEDLAGREFQRAFEIDPTSGILSSDYCAYLIYLRRPDEFFAATRKYFPEQPLLPLYYMMKGDLETAQRRIDEDAAKNGNYETLFWTSYLLALKGERKRSEGLLRKVINDIPANISRRRTDYHHFTYDIACIHAINGNGPEAMKWLRESAERGFSPYAVFARDPFLDKIRQLPEFGQFMTEMKGQHDQLRNEFY